MLLLTNRKSIVSVKQSVNFVFQLRMCEKYGHVRFTFVIFSGFCACNFVTLEVKRLDIRKLTPNDACRKQKKIKSEN